MQKTEDLLVVRILKILFLKIVHFVCDVQDRFVLPDSLTDIFFLTEPQWVDAQFLRKSIDQSIIIRWFDVLLPTSVNIAKHSFELFSTRTYVCFSVSKN